MIDMVNEPPALQYQVENVNHQISGMQQAYDDFKITYPAFASTAVIDALRAQDYDRLDTLKQIYLDYTGGSLYGKSQVHNHMNVLVNEVFGNPHSDNPTSSLSTRMANQARTSVLEYFHASPEEYAVIFTHNATGALKLVGESYPFRPGSKFLLTFDCHNSVNGIREFARAKGTSTTYVPVTMPTLRIDEHLLNDSLNNADANVPNLFAYPAQSNFSGVQHPLELIAQAQAKGFDVLLDAAAFVSTNELNLSLWHPDFVVLSCYKMFGYPTGVGCLIAKHAALAKLKRPWFAGGTVEVVSIQGEKFHFHEGFSAFEDGTINYLSLAAISIGLRHLQSVGVKKIHERVMILTDWLIKQLLSLKHANGIPLIRLYGPSDMSMRGGIIAMNFQGPDGLIIDPGILEADAAKSNISVRVGCFCNPGSIEIINGFTVAELQQYFSVDHESSFEDYVAAFPGKVMGALRVSFGIVTNFADVYQFLQFARSFKDHCQCDFEQLRDCHVKHACNSSC